MKMAADRRFFADPFGTAYAVEVVTARQWSPAFAVPPELLSADARVVICPELPPPGLPGWLVALTDDPSEVDDSEVASLAARAWLRSPYHRAPGALASDYVVAGFQAFCPPHPPCPPGPNARETVATFARRRGGTFAPLGEEGRDGFDRWLRVAWRTPEHFARAILAERMAEAGERDALALVAFVEEADVWPEGDTLTLAEGRRSLIERLTPLRYFADPAGWDQARAEAVEWRAAYEAAYRAHFRRVARLATDTLSDLLPAVSASEVLRTFNRSERYGQPVGEEALDRLRRAVAQIGEIPDTPDPSRARTGGVTLGRLPGAFADARLAAAAVLAAVEVQRRRAMV
ncbi:MAG: hypothetical protein EPO65_02115 [Dehalococcoidia bacterium]|nr:MAG: hypothetical protein EPO65_02115 [Dehalococcoidia bacterium]